MSYIQVQHKGKRTNTYMYLDIEEGKSIQIFGRHKIKVKIIAVMKHKELNTDYFVYVVNVPKKYQAEFEKCMNELSNIMLLIGYTDYEDFCMKIIKDVGGIPDDTE